MNRTEAAAILSPQDEHDRRLLANVNPPGWVNPRPRDCYDLVVVGAGTAGLVAAAGAASLGATVALAERRLMGGDCLNTGCVPSKALLRSARAAADARRAHKLGVIVTDVQTDFAAVMRRMRAARARLSEHDSAERFRGLGVDLFLGRAEFIGPRTVVVGEQPISFRRACIASGGAPKAPLVPGLAESGFQTSETLFSIPELPARMAILGGGPIGCEMAQAFARFGAQVHLIEAESRLLQGEHPDAASLVEKSLQSDGVTVHLKTHLDSVAGTDGEKLLKLRLANGGGKSLTVDELLVAAGRSPNVEDLGLGAAGVAFDSRQGILVDDMLRTTNRRIYAAGDCCSARKFTHLADAQARILVQNALFFGRAKASRLTIPRCTYTDPEVAHVGLSAAEAEAKGLYAETIRIDMARVDRAVLEGEESGFLEVYHQRGKDRILGATIVARSAGEMIGELALAISAGVGLRRIARTIHPYPTQAEAIKKAADEYNRRRLTPAVQRIAKAILKLRR